MSMDKTFVLKSETGLHARPATNFVRFISELPASIYLIHKDFIADAKSIMAILSLGLAKGETFTMRVESHDPEIMKSIELYLKDHNLI
jgi:phosphocarrier protein HPr